MRLVVRPLVILLSLLLVLIAGASTLSFVKSYGQPYSQEIEDPPFDSILYLSQAKSDGASDGDRR